MDCKQARALLGAYVDGELDARGSMDVESHLAHCTRCSSAMNAVRQVKHAVRQSAPAYKAPARLRESVQSRPRQTERPRLTLAWAPVTAVLVVAALALGWMLGKRSTAEDVASTLVSAHMRALMSEHVADVVSTDQHTVKPWFNGKVDYSPPVRDLAAEGFPLEGGRLDYLRSQRVAVLVYGRRKHVIDLYVEPSATDLQETHGAIKGFNIRHWAQRGFEYWAISDVANGELDKFCDLLEDTSG